MLGQFTVTNSLLNEYLLLHKSNAPAEEIKGKLEEYNLAVRIYNSNGMG